MRLALLLVTAVFVMWSSGNSAQADDLPTAAQIEANVDKAEGKAPASYLRVTRYTRSGVAGITTSFISGKDDKTTDSFGPLTRAYGTLSQQEWHQNYNGQTVLDNADPGKAAKDTYTTTVTKIQSPVAGYMVSELNTAGIGEKRYIDSAWHVVRLVHIVPQRNIVIDYDDFRTVASYTRAFHWTVRDGYAQDDADYRIATLEAKTVTTADLAMSPPRRELVEFPAGSKSVELPVHKIGDFFVVRLNLGDRGLDFVLDTGAAGIVMDTSVAQSLGLQGIGERINDVNAGKANEATVVIPEIKIGALAMHDVVVRTVPHAFQAGQGARIVGLLGFDFIAEHLLKLDYQKGTVTAYADSERPHLEGSHVAALDIRLRNEVPFISVTVGASVAERFIADTGASASIVFFPYFERRYPNALHALSTEGYSLSAQGVGGPIEIRPVSATNVMLGSMRFEAVDGALVTSRRSYYTNQDGLVGAKMLGHFDVWLDYANSQIVLVVPPG